MSKHQQKICPRCNQLFECNVASILLCQCASVTLNEKERKYLSEKYNDCICTACMKALKEECK